MPLENSMMRPQTGLQRSPVLSKAQKSLRGPVRKSSPVQQAPLNSNQVLDMISPRKSLDTTGRTPSGYQAQSSTGFNPGTYTNKIPDSGAMSPVGQRNYAGGSQDFNESTGLYNSGRIPPPRTNLGMNNLPARPAGPSERLQGGDLGQTGTMNDLLSQLSPRMNQPKPQEDYLRQMQQPKAGIPAFDRAVTMGHQQNRPISLNQQSPRDFTNTMNPMLQNYMARGTSAGQDMSWMNQPGAISPQFSGMNQDRMSASPDIQASRQAQMLRIQQDPEGFEREMMIRRSMAPR